MHESKHCPACGSNLNEKGICMNEKCPRRKLQIRRSEAENRLNKERSN